jgi:acetyl esterase
MYQLGAEAAKAAYEAGAGVLEIPRQALPRVEDLQIPARDGANLPARLYAPVTRDEAPAAGLPVLLYLHGGGFTVGSVATHDQLCRQLAHLAGCMVVSLDYRLAPQFQFPVAHDDAWDALQWLAAHAASLGADGSRMAVGGDSAGGTLAAACAIEARNTGLKLALQLLIYPGTTAHQDTDSHRRFAHGLVLKSFHHLVLRNISPTPGPRGLALRPCWRPMSTMSHPPGSVWPSAIPWWTRAWNMLTSCAWRACLWIWKSTRA